MPISGFDQIGCTVMTMDLGTDNERHTYRRKLKGGGFVATGVGRVAWIEASLPKRVRDDNVEGLTIPDAKVALAEMIEEASEFIKVDFDSGYRSVEDAKVIRADLVRDFDGVSHLSYLLDGLATVKRSGRVKALRFQDAELMRAETLRVGNGVHHGVVYDKHAETEGKAPLGRLRFEARLRKNRLQSTWAKENGGHVKAVADLAEEKMRQLRRASFEYYGFDREVSALATVADQVLTMDGLSVRERGQFWAFLTIPQFASMLHRNTERKYRRMAAELGIQPGTAIDEVRDSITVRLDYERGTEVLRASAA